MSDRILFQTSSGQRYVFTPALAKRADMVEINPKTGAPLVIKNAVPAAPKAVATAVSLKEGSRVPVGVGDDAEAVAAAAGADPDPSAPSGDADGSTVSEAQDAGAATAPEAGAASPVAGTGVPQRQSFDEMTRGELILFAQDNGIKLNRRGQLVDLLAAVKASGMQPPLKMDEG
jgi:hypothetical protein